MEFPPLGRRRRPTTTTTDQPLAGFGRITEFPPLVRRRRPTTTTTTTDQPLAGFGQITEFPPLGRRRVRAPPFVYKPFDYVNFVFWEKESWGASENS